MFHNNLPFKNIVFNGRVLSIYIYSSNWQFKEGGVIINYDDSTPVITFTLKIQVLPSLFRVTMTSAV